MSAVDVVKAIAVTAELTSTQLSADAMKAMASDLINEFSEGAILAALTRCRRELPGRLTQAAVVERIESQDGRLSGNEAWGIALAGRDEAETIITNDEIDEAMGAARPILCSGDEFGARMAFRDAYDRVVRQNRTSGIKPKWYPSLGTDPARRADAIKAAVDRGLLSGVAAKAFLPAPVTDEESARGAVIAGLLTGNVVAMPKDKSFKARISGLVALLKKKSEAA